MSTIPSLLASSDVAVYMGRSELAVCWGWRNWLVSGPTLRLGSDASSARWVGSGCFIRLYVYFRSLVGSIWRHTLALSTAPTSTPLHDAFFLIRVLNFFSEVITPFFLVMVCTAVLMVVEEELEDGGREVGSMELSSVSCLPIVSSLAEDKRLRTTLSHFVMVRRYSLCLINLSRSEGEDMFTLWHLHLVSCLSLTFSVTTVLGAGWCVLGSGGRKQEGMQLIFLDTVQVFSGHYVLACLVC